MKISKELLGGVVLVESPCFRDNRGGFVKLFNKQIDFLGTYNIEQINFVQNKEANVLRGLHYQRGAAAESKFFRVMTGKIRLGFVDMREDSPSYLQGATFDLESSEFGLLIPRGFATGYLTLQEDTDVLYYSDNTYQPTLEAGLRWDDPKVNLAWNTENPTVSDKDKAWPFV